MARDLLADGRAADVEQMIDPLLAPVDSPANSTGPLLLHALRAQVDVLHRDAPQRALDGLPPLPAVDDLCTCVRAEVALWRGWAHTRAVPTADRPSRALHLLQHAATLFDSINDPRGQAWALLGQAHAYRHLEEYGLMRPLLARADDWAEALTDRPLRRWLHELSFSARRAEGHYEAAEEHLQALRTLGRDRDDRRVRGHAAAYTAALRYDLGEAPASIREAAETAEALLRRDDDTGDAPLPIAYRAHVGALLRRGRWGDAQSVLSEAETTLPDVPSRQSPLQLLRVRIALRQDDPDRAAALLAPVLEQVEALPHGLHSAPLALVRGEVLARQNRLDEAYTWMQRAHRTARDTGHRGRQLRTLLTLARTAAARSDLDAARRHLQAADDYDDYFSVLPYATRRFAAEGTVAQTAGDDAEATDAYRHALAAATLIRDRYRTASLQLALAQLEGEGRAHALASAARSTFERIDAPDEAAVAAALMDGAAASADATAHPHPAMPPTESTLSATLARASLSVPLVASTWLQTAAALLPDDRWLGVYRLSGDGIASLVHEQGVRPDGLAPPPGDDPPGDGPAEWLRLRSAPPTLVLGVERTRSDDPDWATARGRLEAWRPLLRLALERALLHQDRAAPRPAADDPIPVDGFVAESDAMQSVVEDMRRLRPSAQPLLITGESGAGKRLLARAVHATSARADGPLRHVACETMQRTPLSERLFGRVDADGALTPGAVHEADGGTLVVEDVDALPAAAQEALLRLLNTGAVVPHGGTDPVPVDVRVLATTDGSLDEQVRNDHFRPALAEALERLSLHMPPLRERRADIPLLVHHFLDALRSDRVKAATGAAVTPPAMEALLRYDWPGNVRQLRNEVERALVYVESEPAQTIDRDVLLNRIVEEAQSEDASPVDAPDAILRPDQSLSDVLSRTEATVIKRVLRACDGQVTASAEVLGLTRQGLYKKMKRLGIDASDVQPDADPAPASS